MQTFFGTQNFQKNKYVVALGNFDGVHVGHASLLAETVRVAEKRAFLPCVYTFEFSNKGGHLISNNAEKTEIFASFGMAAAVFDDFEKIKDLDCERFCREILVEKLGCEVAVCGSNFRFGKDRCGDAGTLVSEMRKLGKDAIIKDSVYTEDGDMVSSTLIRSLICQGKVSMANGYLGRPYSMSNTVIHGRHLGTELGIPTVNQLFPDGKVVPANGVYSCICRFDGKKYIGVANVGVKPTVNEDTEQNVICETHIVGYQGDLYGKVVTLEFYERLREEKKFDSLDALVAEIQKNIAASCDYFSDRKDIENGI